MHEIPLGEFLSSVQAGARRIPLDGCFELTFRCNLTCAHCYVNEPAGDRAVRDRELPLRRWLALVDEIVEAGCLHLLLTGGEVLLRPDFAEIYRHARRSGLLINVFTNATLVTDAIADLFDRERPDAVEVTLYGFSRETYERVTGVPGSHARCYAGVQRLLDRRLRLRLKTVAMNWNQDELEAMRDFAESRGVEFRYDGQLNERIDGCANRRGDLQVPTEQLIQIDVRDRKSADQFERFCESKVPARWDGPPEPRLFVCGAGRTAFSIDPYGRLLACLLTRRSSIDLRERPFQEGWAAMNETVVHRLRTRPSPCASCNLAPLCDSCPGAAENATGDPEGLVPHFCRLAHERAFAFANGGAGHRRDASCCLGGPPATSRKRIPLRVV